MKIPTADYKLIGTDIKSSVVNTTNDFLKAGRRKGKLIPLDYCRPNKQYLFCRLQMINLISKTIRQPLIADICIWYLQMGECAAEEQGTTLWLYSSIAPYRPIISRLLFLKKETTNNYMIKIKHHKNYPTKSVWTVAAGKLLNKGSIFMCLYLICMFRQVYKILKLVKAS